MVETNHKIELKAAEIANLWKSYMGDTMLICLIENFLSKVEDQEIKSVLEFSYQLSKGHVEKLKSFFNEEKIPVPDGFSVKADVNIDAPRLFTDDFYIFLVQSFAKLNLDYYSFALSTSARFDIAEYFTECLHESSKLFNKSNEVMLSKGIFIRAPYIPKPKMVEYVKKQGFLTGWFGDRRPLNAVEMTAIYHNMTRNQLGRTLCMGFSQVAKSKDVRNYMIRGREIADKHVEIFGSILSEDLLPAASSWDVLPTDSTVPPFSEKLIMFMILSLNGVGIGNYGRGLGISARRDLGSHYTRLISEIALYAEDGANIMIENGWMEQIPQAPDRDKLENKE